MKQNSRFLILLAAAAALLSVPFFAMQFSNEVDWKALDFAIMGTLLFLVVLAIEFVLRNVKGTPKRLLLLGAILGTFFLIWAELAVGVFGTPFAGS